MNALVDIGKRFFGPKEKRRRLLVLSAFLVIAARTASAYPPAPDHTFSGIVRNEWGDPINVHGALHPIHQRRWRKRDDCSLDSARDQLSLDCSYGLRPQPENRAFIAQQPPPEP